MSTLKKYLGKTRNDFSPVSNETLYLSKHSWDCGWYWGFGYLGNRNLHTHFDCLFLAKNNFNPKDVYDHYQNDVPNIWEQLEWLVTVNRVEKLITLFVTSDPMIEDVRPEVLDHLEGMLSDLMAHELNGNCDSKLCAAVDAALVEVGDFTVVGDVFTDTKINQKQWTELVAMFRLAYSLGKAAELVGRGGSWITNPLITGNKDIATLINGKLEVVLDYIWGELLIDL